MPERDCFSMAQPLGSLSPGIVVGVHRHPSMFRHSGKLWQDTLLDGQLTLTEAMVPLDLPAGSVRAALVSSAPQINVGEGWDAVGVCKPTPTFPKHCFSTSKALRCSSPCLPEASLRMLMVPCSLGPHGCGTPCVGWLHGCSSICRLGFGRDVTFPFLTCS